MFPANRINAWAENDQELIIALLGACSHGMMRARLLAFGAAFQRHGTQGEEFAMGSNQYEWSYDVGPNTIKEFGDGLSFGLLALDVRDEGAHLQAERKRASLSIREFGQFKLFRCTTGACSGVHTEVHIGEENDCDDVRVGVNLILDGSVVYTNRAYGGDIFVELTAGHLLIWDSSLPMDFEVRNRLSQLSLVFPKRSLKERLPQIDNLLYRPIDVTKGANAVLGDYMRSYIIQSGISDYQCMRFTELLIEMISVTLAGPDAKKFGGGRSSGELFRDVVDYIDEHLCDSSLSPAEVGKRFYISTRYVHKLFQGSGTTMANYILDERLKRCRREISLGFGKSITDIAYEAGFSDASHFSKAFKHKYGISPKEYRDRLKIAAQEEARI